MSSSVNQALFTDYQRNHIVSVFRHIDGLLQVLESATGNPSHTLFPDYLKDLSPVDADVIAAFAADIRTAIAAKLDLYGIGMPAPKATASHAVQSALTFITIAADELRPKNVRGYGSLTEYAKQELESVVADFESRTRCAVHALMSQSQGVPR